MIDDLDSRVTAVITRVLSVHRDPAEPDSRTPLAGGPLHVSEIEYVYIIMELMEEFGIRFDAADFDNYSLYTVEELAGCVRRHTER